MLNIVSITPQLPSTNPESAGERLVGVIAQALSKSASVSFVAWPGLANERAVNRGVKYAFLWYGEPGLLASATGRWRILAATLEKLRRHFNVLGLMPISSSLISAESQLGKIIGEADVIDLQWEEQGRLAKSIRRINSHARIVVVLHDVLSQKFSRNAESSRSPIRRVYWQIASLRARHLESTIANTVDAIVVLSEKDMEFIPAGLAQVQIIRPEDFLGMPTGLSRSPDSKKLLFVGYLARFENEDALLWLIGEILPLVRSVIPDVQLDVAGRGIRPNVQLAADEATGVNLLDFVEDLETLYSSASCVVVPLRRGAGVKFKVVEALVRAVPIVTSTIGAEGILEGKGLLRGFDSAEDFASEIIRKLQNRDLAEEEARQIADVINSESGISSAEDRLRSAYLGQSSRLEVHPDEER